MTTNTPTLSSDAPFTSADPATRSWNPQRASGMPYRKYAAPHDRVQLPELVDRRWPNARLTEAPLWVPVDLRDGNQALADPMDGARKRRLFELYVRMGYKEIEVGYPSASTTDFDFVRSLATSDLVPDDVTVVVFTAARADLIARTVESVRGLRNVVLHVYIATAPLWRDIVLSRGRAELAGTVRAAAADMLRGADTLTGTHTRFQFSPEVFNLTESEFVLELCNDLTAFWDASPDRPVTHNLPATLEIGTPNLYADQIEFTSRLLDRRGSVILSIHPHNDRGTGVAAAELALLAGAQRVEGCVFGNGERTGNVDIATLALNLYSQGIDPGIDFSDIDAVRETVEFCTRIPVHPRHPYVGELAYTAFSGTHQDAIGKGFAARTRELVTADSLTHPWRVPYLHIDPKDVGRDYEAVVRVNSQSGKGGIAYVLQTDHGIELPRAVRIDFAATVQEATERNGAEITSAELWELFDRTYLTGATPSSLGDEPTAIGTADRVIAAAADAVVDEERSVTSSGRICVFTLVRTGTGDRWSAGIDSDPAVARRRAIAVALSR
ncbi:2-isopropylmalate synthase [Leifsonia poae]|uniref:2-isopropylmalate synthase n=1 Tax=Leifsonia poae TaxID=110933 RepID=UPI001CC09320|nr:2-isopropylmalate synthase [Leifsonia poae]